MPICSKSRRSGAGAARTISAPHQRTAEDWLADFDLRREEIEEALQHVHGGETALWIRRWFFLATSGLFGYAGGSEWGVSHYRMKAAG